MKKGILTFILFAFLCTSYAFAVSVKLEIPIKKNGAPVTDTLDNGKVVTFDTSSDDAEQENDEMDAIYDDDIDAGWEGEPDDQNVLTCGLRFRGVIIPKGATIDSAYIRVNSHEDKNAEDIAELTIVGEAADYAETYTLDALITDRPETNAKVEWTVDEPWTIWEYYRTPDISPIIQEIIDRPGWETGNPVNIIIKGKNQGPSDVENAREFEAFENISDPEDGGDGQNHPERVPKIIIYYSSEVAVLEVPIVKNGDPVTDTLDNGQVVTFDTSSDDAEQENDEMDAIYDDDIDAGWEGEPDDQNVLTCGLRFRNITVPQNAQIVKSYIRVNSHEDKTAEDVAELTIVGEAADNPETYTLDALITDRPETNAKVEWTVDVPWKIWHFYNTPDISPIIQELVNRPGWKPGNAMAIMIKGTNQGPSDLENAREFEAFENISDPEDGGDGQNHPERVPRLYIHYKAGSNIVEIPIKKNGDPVTDTLDNGQVVTFDTSSDDAEQENDEMDAIYDDDIDAGWEGEPDDQNVLTCGLRFRDLPIPHKAEIVNAYIRVNSHEDKSAEDVAELTIVGEAVDNAKTYTLDALITDRPETNAKVEWTVDVAWKIWEFYTTPDISPIIQEIVNRPGWKEGNALAIMIKGKNQGPSDLENAREFEAFENISDPEDGGDGQNHPERVPRLIVEFRDPVSVENNTIHYNSLNVYPNPVSQGSINIELADKMAESDIMLYDQAGSLIKSQSYGHANMVTFEVNNLPTGAYYIKVVQGNEIFTQKVIIE